VRMFDERSRRREGFAAGVPVRLSDGGTWMLPVRDPERVEPDYDALLNVVFEAEDRSEGLRSELALTIYLLDRNYDLSGDELGALLSFEANDPALAELQEAAHRVVLESARRLRVGGRGVSPKGARAGQSRVRRLAGLLRLPSLGFPGFH
jgi:hypothetical protein